MQNSALMEAMAEILALKQQLAEATQVGKDNGSTVPVSLTMASGAQTDTSTSSAEPGAHEKSGRQGAGASSGTASQARGSKTTAARQPKQAVEVGSSSPRTGDDSSGDMVDVAEHMTPHVQGRQPEDPDGREQMHADGHEMLDGLSRKVRRLTTGYQGWGQCEELLPHADLMLEKFDGGDNYRRFKSRFRAMAYANAWDEHTQARYIGRQLDGMPAYEYQQLLNKRGGELTIQDVFGVLDHTYEMNSDTLAANQRLRDFHQGCDQPVGEFCVLFARLMGECTMDLTEMRHIFASNLNAQYKLLVYMWLQAQPEIGLEHLMSRVRNAPVVTGGGPGFTPKPPGHPMDRPGTPILMVSMSRHSQTQTAGHRIVRHAYPNTEGHVDETQDQCRDGGGRRHRARQPEQTDHSPRHGRSVKLESRRNHDKPCDQGQNCQGDATNHEGHQTPRHLARDTGGTCHRCKQAGHQRSVCPEMQCRKCGAYGHMSKRCTTSTSSDGHASPTRRGSAAPTSQK